MKVTNLMRGDWVLDTRTGRPLRVNPFMAELEVPEWQPIPLTPEILEKNGFNEPPLEMQKRVRFVVLCEEYQIRYSFNSYWFSIYKNIAAHAIGYPTFICAFQERIKYVHELQHALRLCKVDKEIVL